MSTPGFNLDSFDNLDGFLDDSSTVPLPDGTAGTSEGTPWSEPGYDGNIDYRIRQLSYSSFLTLHSCPRKFQLYKLRANRAPESKDSEITFSFGHAVGHAIQQALCGKSDSQIIWELFLQWPGSLDETHSKYRKSIWEAIIALQKFQAIRNTSVLSDYEVVLIDGVPAVELSFCINFPDGFRYRGHVDLVLQHRTTGEILVLELKTTGSKTLSPSTYKNSAQAIGYSIVLDHIFPTLSSYHVLYLVYQSESREYTPFFFTKSYLQRALWIQEVLLDIETIKLYENAQVYPMRGESCHAFFRDCEYINTCTLSTPLLTKPCTQESEDTTTYTVNVSLLDLLNTQLRNVGAPSDEDTLTNPTDFS
jgi:PD-(D/E)XK nuclease superfamily